MKIKVLIVEDESLIAQEIAECLEENEFEITEIVSTSGMAMRSIKERKPDVILMDISIKGEEDGISLSRRILQEENFPIVFLTSHTETKIFKEASVLKPSAFLLKPFNEQELPIAIELAFSNHNKEVITKQRPVLKDSIFVKNGKKFQKIKLEDILFIEAEGSYSRIKTRTNEFMISFNLSQFHEEIDNDLFCRVHRSFIVNLTNIDSFDLTNITISGRSIPISKQFHEKLVRSVKKL